MGIEREKRFSGLFLGELIGSAPVFGSAPVWYCSFFWYCSRLVLLLFSAIDTVREIEYPLIDLTGRSQMRLLGARALA